MHISRYEAVQAGYKEEDLTIHRCMGSASSAILLLLGTEDIAGAGVRRLVVVDDLESHSYAYITYSTMVLSIVLFIQRI